MIMEARNIIVNALVAKSFAYSYISCHMLLGLGNL
jgi:hypothetical protein